MREINITLSASEINSDRLTGRIAVVIDILRATSVIVTALHNGAVSIKPVLTVEEAITLRTGSNLLGGERNAERIEGFDLGNSPVAYTGDRVAGKEIILTTTNGTQAILKTTRADKVLIGSFLNARSIYDYLINTDQPVELICSGTDGEFSLDDFLCAGLIAKNLLSPEVISGNDLVNLAIKSWKDAEPDISLALRDCRHYHILKSKGYDEDLAHCLTVNKINILPVVDPLRGTILVMGS